jgi:flagellar motility protein MotE (MotC chaperone)
VKKLFTVIAFALALNFLAVAGGVAYLWQTKRLDREKVHAIREMVFPPASDATTKPSAEFSDAATQPAPSSLKLDELLAQHANRPAAEQVQLLQRTFDSRLAQVDMREREVRNLQDLVANAERKLKADRETLEQERAALETREQESARLAGDKGFQDSLQLYGTMKPKQVKDVFAGLSDEVVVRYLRAMPPRQATKILAEFKTPAELDRVKVLMERVRAAAAESAGTTQTAAKP